jgi:hypothetical protein
MSIKYEDGRKYRDLIDQVLEYLRSYSPTALSVYLQQPVALETCDVQME